MKWVFWYIVNLFAIVSSWAIYIYVGSAIITQVKHLRFIYMTFQDFQKKMTKVTLSNGATEGTASWMKRQALFSDVQQSLTRYNAIRSDAMKARNLYLQVYCVCCYWRCSCSTRTNSVVHFHCGLHDVPTMQYFCLREIQFVLYRFFDFGVCKITTEQDNLAIMIQRVLITYMILFVIYLIAFCRKISLSRKNGHR